MTPKKFQILSRPQQRQYLIQQGLANIPFDGWSFDSLRSVEQQLQIPTGTADRIFDFDTTTMATAFADYITTEMLTALKATHPQPTGTTNRIATALKIRLHIMEPHKQSVQMLVRQFGTTPQTHAHTAWQACDVIWNWAGDTSTDYNHYTKRGLLVGVYTATVLYWLSDDSPNYTATHNFIDRQLQTIVQTGKTVKSALSHFKR